MYAIVYLFDWRTPVLTHNHSLCSNRIGRNPKGWSGDKITADSSNDSFAGQTIRYHAHPAWNKTLSGSWPRVSIFVVCISRRECKEEGQSRWTRCLMVFLCWMILCPLRYFQNALSQTWLKTRGPGIWFTLEIIGSKFQQQVFCCWCGTYCSHLPMRTVSHSHHVLSAHDRWVSVSSIQGDCEPDVSGQVHKCLQTMRSHVNCCVRFRVSSFIRPSAEVSCRNVNMISICSVLRHRKGNNSNINDIKNQQQKQNTTRDIQGPSRDHDNSSFQRYVSRGEHVSMLDRKSVV